MKNFHLKHLLITLFSFFLTYSYTIGQDASTSICGANIDYSQLPKQEIDANLLIKVKEIIAEKENRFEKSKQALKERAAIESSSYCFTIPYIVHVLHDGEAVGVGPNVSNLQIQSQIDFINDFFLQSGVNIQFLPALYDENNNALSEPGVNRINLTDPQLVGGELELQIVKDIVMPMYIWNTIEYFNIFLIKDITGGTAGLGYFPPAPILTSVDLPPNELNAIYLATSIQDGICVEHDVFTSSTFGGPAPVGNRSNYEEFVALHEIGHWLGLRHVSGDWWDGCTRDDGCLDTPNTSTNDLPGTNCANTPDQCGDGNFPTTNIMTDEHGCLDEFTTCQFGRMLQTLQVDPVRSLLVQSDKASTQNNCINCGLNVSISGLPSFTDSATPITLSGNPSGGTFSGPGIQSNVFNPSIAGSGDHPIAYVYKDVNGCIYTVIEYILVSCSLDIGIMNLPPFTLSTSPISLYGTPPGGTFSGPGVIFNAFNPSVSGSGIHTIEYEVTDANGTCTASDEILVYTITYNFVTYNLGTISPRLDGSTYALECGVTGGEVVVEMTMNEPYDVEVKLIKETTGQQVFLTSNSILPLGSGFPKRIYKASNLQADKYILSIEHNGKVSKESFEIVDVADSKVTLESSTFNGIAFNSAVEDTDICINDVCTTSGEIGEINLGDFYNLAANLKDGYELSLSLKNKKFITINTTTFTNEGTNLDLFSNLEVGSYNLTVSLIQKAGFIMKILNTTTKNIVIKNKCLSIPIYDGKRYGVGEELKVSSNPATDFVNIQSSLKGEFFIFNAQGMEMEKFNLSELENEKRIDLSDWPIGSYFIRHKESNTLKKIIKL